MAGASGSVMAPETRVPHFAGTWPAIRRVREKPGLRGSLATSMGQSGFALPA
jgi:hypothetical protein